MIVVLGLHVQIMLALILALILMSVQMEQMIA